MKRQTLRRYALNALRQEFGEDFVVTDNVFVRFDAGADHLVVYVSSDAVPGEPDLDSRGMVDVTLMVRSSSGANDAQDVLDERMERVQETLVNEAFLESVGGVAATYVGYEFEIDDGYATGDASIDFTMYEEIGT